MGLAESLVALDKDAALAATEEALNANQDPLALVDEARRATDQNKRMRLYAQAERILAEQVPILPLVDLAAICEF